MHLGGDCQDNNPDIYPDYTDNNTGELAANENEVWYDGIDSNCDGVDDYDQDGDGYGALSAGRGSDCDDTDPLVNIEVEEKLNGMDDNCDDIIDQDVPGFNSDETYTGVATNDAFGYAVIMGDMDEDGYDDLMVGVTGYNGGDGAMAIYSGASLPSSDADGDGDVDEGTVDYTAKGGSDNLIEGAIKEGNRLGASIAFYDDSRGTGDPVIAIGAPSADSSAGTVYIMTASNAIFAGTIDSAFLTVSGTSSNQRVGAGLVPQAEINGDGINDYIGRYTSGSSHAIWLLYGGSVINDYTLDDVDATFTAGGNKNIAERSMSPTGDINGDGYEDFVFCDHGYNSTGALWVLWGDPLRYGDSISVSGSLASDGTRVFVGSEYEKFGKTCGIGPDWDNDGVAELWVHTIDPSDDRAGIFMISGSTDLEDANQHPIDSTPAAT